MSAAPPLAYVYDRCVTPNPAMLELRLATCAEYVTEQGWEWGGQWVDKGDDALTSDRRPAFDALVCSMQSTPAVPRVCLVYDWGRLSHSREQQRAFARRVLVAGGWLATIGGETTRIDAIPDGRLTTAPQVVA